ncbi:hypothetical protein Pan44_17970 [Caulifigura coniformis]|uniref:Uncharacterized protein n=1 Tax=Caulifigura coniformis TaxID=2527983 RepID=A0A517SCD6_9PLAN|nr:hypothetical protein [Caulifigura coniformis]QDT53774.1 hypothetical protein Pan44_17970 [Caulifigura coniformis]
MTRRSRRTENRDQSGRLKARLFSMIVMLAVIGLLYNRARDARTWTWLVSEPGANEEVAAQASAPPAKVVSAKETVLDGPTDLDEEQRAEAAKLLAAVTDRQKLVDVEMPAYWRLLGWAQAQSFQDLEKRSQRDVPLTKLHEEPGKYRGQPIRLRLNVKRILDFDAPENSVGLKKVYEAWGWTNDSKARPYVVVLAELPAGVKVGTDVDHEVVFAGYFLKWMQYETFKGQKQTAPLLLGRLKPAPPAAAAAKPAPWTIWDIVFFAGGAAIIGFGVRSAFRRSPPRRRLLAAEADVESAMEFFRSEGEVRPTEGTATKSDPSLN